MNPEEEQAMNRRPAIDPDLLAALYELADGEPSFLHDLLETFEQRSVELVRELRAGVLFANRLAFGRAAHALAGCAMNIGAMDLSTICRELELAMALGSSIPMISDFDRILNELNRALYESRDLSLDHYLDAVQVS
jgi:HPt (histidine-containing phosphotransfer) domain-containing protein